MSLHAQDVPNAANFLPAPPSTTSMEYINDYAQYIWGKSVRSTSRGDQARSDMSWELSSYLSVFSNILGIELSASNTHNIYEVLNYGMKYATMAIEKSQASYFNKRPYVRYNEHSQITSSENQYAASSSYPSAQATYGWLLGMLLTEICPARQNQLIARGYQFGESSIISGYNWYSDVHTGRDLATLLMIYFHTQNGFNLLVKSARAEYESKAKARSGTTRFLTYESLPNPLRYLPSPPDTLSVMFAYDMYQYIDTKKQRLTYRGTTAKEDCNSSVGYLCEVFSSLFGTTISESKTPEIYTLVSRMRDLALNACAEAKDYYLRPRPYERFNETTIYPDDEDELRYTGSYPSGHATLGWLVGLALSEINPNCQELVMQRAYEYGMSRVIAGYHWISDIEAGRLAAGASFARLHSDEGFLEQMEKAVREYKGLPSGVRPVSAEAESQAPIYTLDGIRLDQEPSHHGIFIQGNRKVAR